MREIEYYPSGEVKEIVEFSSQWRARIIQYDRDGKETGEREIIADPLET